MGAGEREGVREGQRERGQEGGETMREGQREWAREGAEEGQGSLLWKTVLGRLILPIGEAKTPSPALCIVMGAGWGYRNGLDTECPDSVGFTIWWEVRHWESHHINNVTASKLCDYSIWLLHGCCEEVDRLLRAWALKSACLASNPCSGYETLNKLLNLTSPQVLI